MALIVQKFGGSSVADAERVMNVANIVANTYRDGNDVIVVVSAQGDTTDDLIAKAEEINPKHSRREMDQLLSAGEQISISLLAMALEKLRIPVISLLGWQAGFKTNSQYTMARIKKIDVDRVNSELDKNKVIVVAGFQGLNKYDDITTPRPSAAAVPTPPLSLWQPRSTPTNARSSPMSKAFTPPTRGKSKTRTNSKRSPTTKCWNSPPLARRS